ncbi:MAG: SHOCT domain-containing protein [Rubrivivax sp.]|jgi:putative membrane protein
MYFGNGFYMGGMHGLWWLFWIVLIGALVYAAWGRPSGRRRGSTETPHEVLRRRLASGEIDAQEYEQRKALLDRDAGRSG